MITDEDAIGSILGKGPLPRLGPCGLFLEIDWGLVPDASDHRTIRGIPGGAGPPNS